jgi:hypothetical protein
VEWALSGRGRRCEEGGGGGWGWVGWRGVVPSGENQNKDMKCLSNVDEDNGSGGRGGRGW